MSTSFRTSSALETKRNDSRINQSATMHPCLGCAQECAGNLSGGAVIGQWRCLKLCDERSNRTGPRSARPRSSGPPVESLAPADATQTRSEMSSPRQITARRCSSRRSFDERAGPQGVRPLKPAYLAAGPAGQDKQTIASGRGRDLALPHSGPRVLRLAGWGWGCSQSRVLYSSTTDPDRKSSGFRPATLDRSPPSRSGEQRPFPLEKRLFPALQQYHVPTAAHGRQ